MPDMQGRSPQANLPEEDSILPDTGLRKRVSLRSPVRKNRTPGSVRGASGNRRPYRDARLRNHPTAWSEFADLTLADLRRNYLLPMAGQQLVQRDSQHTVTVG